MDEPTTAADARSLCAVHRDMWFGYKNLTYNPRCPSEWPGGSLHMDNRTSHAQRRADWESKSQAQCDLIVSICRSGKSRQCSG